MKLVKFRNSVLNFLRDCFFLQGVNFFLSLSLKPLGLCLSVHLAVDNGKCRTVRLLGFLMCVWVFPGSVSWSATFRGLNTVHELCVICVFWVCIRAGEVVWCGV